MAKKKTEETNEKQDIVENVGAIFGPKNTYKIKAKVYNCKN